MLFVLFLRVRRSQRKGATSSPSSAFEFPTTSPFCVVHPEKLSCRNGGHSSAEICTGLEDTRRRALYSKASNEGYGQVGCRICSRCKFSFLIQGYICCWPLDRGPPARAVMVYLILRVSAFGFCTLLELDVCRTRRGALLLRRRERLRTF
jgi:hypothetical protein